MLNRVKWPRCTNIKLHFFFFFVFSLRNLSPFSICLLGYDKLSFHQCSQPLVSKFSAVFQARKETGYCAELSFNTREIKLRKNTLHYIYTLFKGWLKKNTFLYTEGGYKNNPNDFCSDVFKSAYRKPCICLLLD